MPSGTIVSVTSESISEMSRRHKATAIAPYALLVLSAILLCLSVALALTGSLRSGKSDAQRYADVSAACNKKYNGDMARGIKYAVYPCEDSTLAEEFKRAYGYEYKR